MRINLYSENSSLSYSWAITFIVIGVLCLIIGVGVIFLYRYNKKKRLEKENTMFKTTNRQFSHQMFSFWSNYVYFFIIVVAFIVGVIFIPIGIGALV